MPRRNHPHPPAKRDKFWTDNGLTLTLSSLFILFLAGQILSGANVFNQVQVSNHLSPVSYWEYVRSGTFLEAVLENWQAAILQLASLIFFGAFLRQRGAAHSADPDRPHKRPSDVDARGKRVSWFFAHSLVLTLLGLFVLFFLSHLFAAAAAYRATQQLLHLPALSIGAFAFSAQFWFATFQTWQAEFFAIALYVVLTIFLREEGSPESKPVNASNRETGKTDA